MIVCTAEAKECIRNWLSFSDHWLSFCGLRVYTLPGAAFAGMMDSGGEEVNMILVEMGGQQQFVLRNWQALQNGTLTLSELALEDIVEPVPKLLHSIAARSGAMVDGAGI